MKKVLLVATVQSHICQFHKPLINLLQSNGIVVHVAARNNLAEKNGLTLNEPEKVFDIPFSRSPVNKCNLTAYKMLKRIIYDEKYDVVHCNTPVGGLLARLVCKKLRKKMGVKVIYTAHGFHFYKGAPFKNWLLYYPIEKYCSRFTDVLITINKEDYELAKRKMKAKRVEYVPGVGVDTKKFASIEVDRNAKRKELGVPENAVLLISVGELNDNKNHEIVIRALAQPDIETNVYYLIAGNGEKKQYLEGLIHDLHLDGRVKLLGYRRDIGELYKVSDVCVFPSIREGLGLAALEGMSCGLPLLAADNRGVKDYAINHVNAILCRYNHVNEFVSGINTFVCDSNFRKEMGEKNKKIVIKFDIEIILSKMKLIYGSFIGV